MYLSRLKLENFKSFSGADAEFRNPGDGGPGPNNITIVLGDNASGKTALLQAIAIGLLGDNLGFSGYSPFWLIRRPNAVSADIRATLTLSAADFNRIGPSIGEETIDAGTAQITTETEITFNSRWDREEIRRADNDAFDSISDLFLTAYSAQRQIETSAYSESQQNKTRATIYQRIAGLFEERYRLRPFDSWYRKHQKRHAEIKSILNSLLPSSVNFDGVTDDIGTALRIGELNVPYLALSEGYKGFMSWLGDLLSRMCDSCSEDTALVDMAGIVLVDEIDLHLHPQWQRSVVPALANALPKMQFILTTHSPIVLSSVRKENVLLAEKLGDGTATIKRLEESTFGRGVEQLLMSGYFGLSTPRSSEFTASANQLFERAADGDGKAALAYLEQLAKLPQDLEEVNLRFEEAQSKIKGDRSAQ